MVSIMNGAGRALRMGSSTRARARAGSAGDPTHASTNAANSARKRSAENRSALARHVRRPNRRQRVVERAHRGGDRLGRLLVEEHPGRRHRVRRSRTVSRLPPRPYAITGVPQACASTGRMPKSSSAANTNARAPRSSSRRRSARHLADELDVRPGRAPHASRFGAVARHHQPPLGKIAKGRGDQVHSLVRHPARRGDVVVARGRLGGAPRRA